MLQRISITCFLAALLLSCNSKDKKSTTVENGSNPTKDTITVKERTDENITTTPLIINDTGQQYFKVVVTKNNQILAEYEGDFAIPLFSENLFNLQMPANKRMLKISHFLVLYFNSPAVGSFPIAPSGNEKGKPTLIFTPEVDGNYGIGISADSGTVVFTKFSDKTLSGSIDASGKDTEGKKIHIRAAFINLKNNSLE